MHLYHYDIQAKITDRTNVYHVLIVAIPVSPIPPLRISARYSFIEGLCSHTNRVFLHQVVLA